MDERSIVCTLDAAALARRQADLSSQLFHEAVRAESLEHGRRWYFLSSADILTRIAHVIEAERQCCRFLHFVVEAQPDLGEIKLDVTGPAGTREFLESWQ